jgi:hypothetical protein
MSDDKEYQEYLEYMEYLESQGGEEPQAPPSAQYQAPIGPGVGAVQSWADAGERAKTIIGLGDKQALWPEGSNPEKYPVKGTPPMVAPAAGMAQVAGKVGTTMASQGPMQMTGISTRAADLANKNFATRIAANTGASGLEALLKGHPEDAGGNMGAAATASTILEGMGGVAKIAGMGMKAGGRALTRVSKEQADDYANQSGLAEDLFNLEKNHPDQLAERALGESKEALERLQANSTAPAMEELNRRTAPQNFRVKTDQFKGTAAGDEIQRSWNAQGKQLDVPVMERHSVQATPVKAGIEYGKPSAQTLPVTPPREIPAGTFANQSKFTNLQDMGEELQQRHARKMAAEFDSANARGFNPYTEAPTAEVSTVQRSISKAGEPQTLEELLLPAGKQQIPAPLPGETSLTGAQLLRAKRASGDAMNANRAKNPLGYRAADDTEAKAMASLRKAMRSVDPKAAQLDRTVEKNLRISNEVKNLGNPSRIYSGGDSMGSVPIRQAQQHLDKLTGSNFTMSGKALDAGRAVNQPGTGVIDDLAVKPLGRSLLRNSSKAKGAGENIPNALIIQWLAEQSSKKEE